MLLLKKKQKLKLPIVEINIVSLMDVITTLLFFLILILSFVNYSIIKATSLSVGKPSNEKPKPTFSLKVSVTGKNSINILVGPVNELKIVNKKDFLSFMRRFYKGSPSKGYSKIILNKSKDKLIEKLQSYLIKLKKAFPHETKALVAFNDKVESQLTIDLISAVRTLDEKSSSFNITNLLGHTKKTKVLFPEVIISEWDEGM